MPPLPRYPPPPFTPPLCTPPPYNMGLGQNCLGCVSFWSQISQIYSHINHNISSTPCHPFPGIPPPLPHPCVPHPLANMGLGQNCLGCVSFWSQVSQIYSHINHNILSTPCHPFPGIPPPLPHPCVPHPLANMGLGQNCLGCVSFWSQISQIYSHINHTTSSTPCHPFPGIPPPPLPHPCVPHPLIIWV